jgi:hypothetical protein
MQMFVQMIQGRVSDADAVRAQLDKWREEVSPGAVGWLGSTGGVTADGRLVALVRFESEEAAQRNSDRPEQGAWWEGMAACFDGEPVFHNSNWVQADEPGDPDKAGFVQVMQGRTKDVQRGRELMNSDSEVDWNEFRPDILGTLMVNYDDDGWAMAIYFTSEAEARAGEQKPPPPDMAEAMAELDTLAIGETEYFDLTDPWLMSP